MIFCSKNPDARAHRKGSLSSLPRQRAAEIGRKKATASCGSGREGAGGNYPCCASTPATRWVAEGVRVPPVPPGSEPAQKIPARAQPRIAGALGRQANVFLASRPAPCTRSRSCPRAGRRKTRWLRVCREWRKATRNDTRAPGLALSCRENRACKMLSVPPAQQREKPRGATFPLAVIWVHAVAAVSPFPSLGFSSRHPTKTVPGCSCLPAGAGLMQVCSRGADLCSRVQHGTGKRHSTSASPPFSGCCTYMGHCPARQARKCYQKLKGRRWVAIAPALLAASNRGEFPHKVIQLCISGTLLAGL